MRNETKHKTQKRKKVDSHTSAILMALHQEMGVSCAELSRRYKGISSRSIYRHTTATKSADGTERKDGRHKNKGWPKKLNTREKRHIIRTLVSLQKQRASFNAKTIQEKSGLTYVSTKTIHRILVKIANKSRKKDY